MPGRRLRRSRRGHDRVHDRVRHAGGADAGPHRRGRRRRCASRHPTGRPRPRRQETVAASRRWRRAGPGRPSTASRPAGRPGRRSALPRRPAPPRRRPGGSRGARPRPAGGSDGLALALAGPVRAATGTPAATAPGPLGQLVGDLGHRQVLAVVGDPPAAARGALLDLGDLDDVGEDVGDVDEVRRGVAAEADDLDPDAHLLDGPDGRGEVAVAGDDDRDIQVPGGLHHVDDELDVEVRLDLAVAVLADVLAHHLVAVARAGSCGSCAGSRCPGRGPCTRTRARSRDRRWPT